MSIIFTTSSIAEESTDTFTAKPTRDIIIYADASANHQDGLGALATYTTYAAEKRIIDLIFVDKGGHFSKNGVNAEEIMRAATDKAVSKPKHASVRNPGGNMTYSPPLLRSYTLNTVTKTKSTDIELLVLDHVADMYDKYGGHDDVTITLHTDSVAVEKAINNEYGEAVTVTRHPGHGKYTPANMKFVDCVSRCAVRHALKLLGH